MSTVLTSEDPDPNTIVVYLPRIYDPGERIATLERPIGDLLKTDCLGIVDGGGTWFHGASDVWVYTRNTAQALSVLRPFLAQASVPEATQIQYSVAGINLHDEYCQGRWKTARPALYHKLGLAFAA